MAIPLLNYEEVLSITHPEQSEASLRTFPHIVAVRITQSELGPFRHRLRGAQVEATTFYRASLLGRGAWTVYSNPEELVLQSFVAYGDLLWRSPYQTLHQAPLPLLVLPAQEHGHTVNGMEYMAAHLSYRRILSEVAIARDGAVSPTLFLSQGCPGARYQCRRIMEEISAGLEEGMPEASLRLLERALVTTVAHHWNPDKRCGEGSHRHVTLAIDWIQLHLNEPFAWSALCRDVGITQRCLERAFQRELQLSPNRWLKQERLRSLRQRLLDPEQSVGVPLALLFENCGLPYCGSTQRAYNRLYGETPAHTRYRASRGV